MTAPLITALEQAGEGSRLLLVDLNAAPFTRTFFDALNGYATGGSGRCLETLAIWNARLAASTPVGGWEEPVAWRYPVLTARDEAVARMARAMRNGKAWPAVFQANTAEALAEDALAALEALAVIPTEGGGRD